MARSSSYRINGHQPYLTVVFNFKTSPHGEAHTPSHPLSLALICLLHSNTNITLGSLKHSKNLCLQLLPQEHISFSQSLPIPRLSICTIVVLYIDASALALLASRVLHDLPVWEWFAIWSWGWPTISVPRLPTIIIPTPTFFMIATCTGWIGPWLWNACNSRWWVTAIFFWFDADSMPLRYFESAACHTEFLHLVNRRSAD